MNRDALEQYWAAAGWVNEARHDPSAHAGRTSVKRSAIPVGLKRDLAERDGWRCRYCGVRLLSKDFLANLTRLFPLDFADTGRHATQHPALAVLRFNQDHVTPRSAGGPNTLDNLVSSCGTCNYAKSDCSIEELGLQSPFSRDAFVDDWDGLAGRFGPVTF